MRKKIVKLTHRDLFNFWGIYESLVFKLLSFGSFGVKTLLHGIHFWGFFFMNEKLKNSGKKC